MARIARECSGVKVNEVLAKTVAEVRAEVSERLGRELGQALETEIDLMLGREAYVRREKVASWVETEGVCQRCKSRQSRRFSRNGRRRRRLLTCWDEVTLWQQRLVCECGGSVRLELAGWLRPYQRIGEDVDEQIRRWGALRISLREMQEELAHLHISPLALSTLNRRLHQVRETAAADRPLTVPPVLQVDAIWVTQLLPTGGHRLDRKGRRRPVKRRIKRPIFIALGVWPETEYAEVIAWRLADKEDEGDWLAFLSELEALGVRGENGLELVIHDGGSGLCAALNTIYFGATENVASFTSSAISAMPFALTTTSSPPKKNAAAALRSCATSVTSGMPNSSLPCSNAFAQLSAAIAPRNQQPSVVCAPTSVPPSPISLCSNAIQTGTAVSCAPPVGSSASTVICGAGFVPPLPIIPMQASALWLLTKSVPSSPPMHIPEFQPLKIHNPTGRRRAGRPGRCCAPQCARKGQGLRRQPSCRRTRAPIRATALCPFVCFAALGFAADSFTEHGSAAPRAKAC